MNRKRETGNLVPHYKYGGSGILMVLLNRVSPSSLLLCAVFAAAIWLGAVHIRHSIWYDEGLTWRILQGETWSEITLNALTQKPMPPLYFFLTWLSWHGIGGEVGLRLVSLLCGLGSMGLIVLLGTRWAGRAAGIAGAALMMATPGFFYYFVDGNPYSILVFAVLLSLWALDRALEWNRISDWTLYGVTLIIGLSVHTLFIIYGAAQWLVPWIRRFQKRGRMPDSEMPRAGFFKIPPARFCMVVLGVLLLWSVWVCFYFQAGGFHNPPNAHRLLSWNTLFCMAGMIPGPLTYGHWIQWIVFPILLVAGLYRVWKSLNDKLLAWLALWILPVVAIAAFVRLTQNFIGYRYALGVFPLTALLIAWGSRMDTIWPNQKNRVHRRLWDRVLQSLFLVYVLAGLGQLALRGEGLFTYQDWRQAAAYLQRSADSHDSIWVSAESASYPLRFYDSSAKTLSIVWPEADGGKEELDDLMRRGRLAAENRTRVWVVLQDFANPSAWIEKRTRYRSYKNSGSALPSALCERSNYRLIPVQKYKRIRILMFGEKP